MYQRLLQGITFVFFAAISAAAGAAIIPFGIQTNVSQATVDSWGWTECHRSAADSYGLTATNTVDANCTGDYMMMGVWDADLGVYGVTGAGETAVVTNFVYSDFNSDNGGVILNNWSNGLNFYRTSGAGSWGFTTIDQTALNSADILLINGPNNFLSSGGRDDQGELARGMSIHTNTNGTFGSGWCYNPDGNNQTCFYSPGDERVFWTANAAPAPEPATLALLTLGLASLAFRHKVRKSS